MNALILIPLAVAAWFDHKKRIIPDSTWLAILLLRIVLGVQLEHILWGGIVFLLLYVWFIFVPGLGGGDVKLLSAMAFFLGENTVVFMIITFLIAVIYGTVMYIRTKDKHYLIPLAVPVLIATIIMTIAI